MIMAGTSSRRLIHFDLLQEGLEYFHMDSSAAYRRIRSWMDGHGFDHDQLSGYLSRSPLTDREIYRLHDQFIRENPEIAACIEGFQVSTITQRTHNQKSQAFRFRLREGFSHGTSHQGGTQQEPAKINGAEDLPPSWIEFIYSVHCSGGV